MPSGSSNYAWIEIPQKLRLRSDNIYYNIDDSFSKWNIILPEYCNRHQQEDRGEARLRYKLFKPEAEADNKDKFLIQKENINKEMHFVKGKLQER